VSSCFQLYIFTGGVVDQGYHPIAPATATLATRGGSVDPDAPILNS